MNQLVLVAHALRRMAALMTQDPDNYSQEDGQILDRALRICPGITDIDVVWVRWRYVGEPRGWITDKELTLKRGRYVYPSNILQENNDETSISR